VSNLTYVNGFCHGSFIDGTLLLAGTNTMTLLDCYSAEGDSMPVIDMNGGGRDCRLVGFNGAMKFINLTDPNTSIEIYCTSGVIVLDSSITQGDIKISGSCRFDNLTTEQPGLVIDTSGLSNPTEQQYGGVIYVDTISGSTGVTYPKGTLAFPCKTLADALTIAEARGIRNVKFAGEITLDRAFTNYTISGLKSVNNGTVYLNNQSLDAVVFENCIVRGHLNAVAHAPDAGWGHESKVEFRSCYLEDIEHLEGIFSSCQIEGTTTLRPGGWVSSVETVIEGDNTIFDMSSTAGTVLSMDINSGWVQVINAVDGCLIELNLKGGEVSLYDSCTGGEYYLEGVGTLFNESNMTVKENHLIWDELAEYHEIEGSVGAKAGEDVADKVWRYARA